jgi:hypothetical protein
LIAGLSDKAEGVPPQIVRRFEELDATRRSFISRFTVKQLVASVRSKSARARGAKIPIAPAAPLSDAWVVG